MQIWLSGTYRHKTGIRPPSCAKPQQLTVDDVIQILTFSDSYRASVYYALVSLLNV